MVAVAMAEGRVVEKGEGGREEVGGVEKGVVVMVVAQGVVTVGEATVGGREEERVVAVVVG
jgi:hypothetical protein